MNIATIARNLSDTMIDNLRHMAVFGHARIKGAQADALVRRGLAERRDHEDAKTVFITETGKSVAVAVCARLSMETVRKLLADLELFAYVDDRDRSLPRCDCQGRSGRYGGHAAACRRKAPLLDQNETVVTDEVYADALAEDMEHEAAIEVAQGRSHTEACNIVFSRRALLASADQEEHADRSLDHFVRFGVVPFPSYTLRYRLYSERLTAALAEFRRGETETVVPEPVEEPPAPTLTVVPSRVTAGLPLYTETREGEEFTHLSIPTWGVTLCGVAAPGEHGTADSAALVDCLDCLDKHTASLAA